MDAKRIMVVEDEGVVGEDIRECLADVGYDVCSLAMYGEEAVERAEQERPDLILMDIALAGEMDGIDAADKIRERLKIPVVFLTAYTDKDFLSRAKRTGAFGYLLKPFQPRELHATIEMALSKAKVEQERDLLLEEKELLIRELEKVLAEGRIPKRFVQVCSSCTKIRDDKGYWQQNEKYILDHLEAQFSHGICPDCVKKLYPELYKELFE